MTVCLSLGFIKTVTAQEICTKSPDFKKERCDPVQLEKVKEFLQNKFDPEITKDIIDVWNGKRVEVLALKKNKQKRQQRKKIPSAWLKRVDVNSPETSRKERYLKPLILKKKDSDDLSIHFVIADWNPKKEMDQPITKTTFNQSVNDLTSKEEKRGWRGYLKDLINRIISLAKSLFCFACFWSKEKTEQEKQPLLKSYSVETLGQLEISHYVELVSETAEQNPDNNKDVKSDKTESSLETKEREEFDTAPICFEIDDSDSDESTSEGSSSGEE